MQTNLPLKSTEVNRNWVENPNIPTGFTPFCLAINNSSYCVQSTILQASDILSQSSKQAYEAGTRVTPISQMRKPRTLLTVT